MSDRRENDKKRTAQCVLCALYYTQNIEELSGRMHL